MKLLVSALLLAATSLVFGQNAPQHPGPDLLANPPTFGPEFNFLSAGCPLALTSASVAPAAGYLPVSPEPGHDGALRLQFRNSSGKAVRSATITAHLRVKRNIYALDASPVDVQLTFSGTRELDRDLEQLRRIPLPDHAYLFGVAQVSLDQVVFADGTFWISQGTNSCSVRGGASLPIEAK